MKNWLTVSCVVVGCSAIFVILPMTQEVVAGVAEKVSKAQETLKCSPSVKQQIKAVKALGDANDCDKDCGGFKVMATKELKRLADQDCCDAISEAARKELRKDLKRKETSVTRQRVSQALGK